jgi:hypothetical protein
MCILHGLRIVFIAHFVHLLFLCLREVHAQAPTSTAFKSSYIDQVFVMIAGLTGCDLLISNCIFNRCISSNCNSCCQTVVFKECNFTPTLGVSRNCTEYCVPMYYARAGTRYVRFLAVSYQRIMAPNWITQAQVILGICVSPFRRRRARQVCICK